MTPQETKYYVEAMKIIEARERLKNMDAIQYPNLNQQAKKKKHRDLYKQAYPTNFKEKVVKTTDLELF